MLQMFVSFFLRAHRPWRATWRVSQAFWRQIFQTTKTKSFAFYAPCKFTPALTLFFIYLFFFTAETYQCFSHADSHRALTFGQRPPPPRETDGVHYFSRPPQRQELQLRGRVCGGDDQTAEGDVEKQLVQWSRLLGNPILQKKEITSHTALKNINVWELFWTF